MSAKLEALNEKLSEQREGKDTTGKAHSELNDANDATLKEHQDAAKAMFEAAEAAEAELKSADAEKGALDEEQGSVVAKHEQYLEDHAKAMAAGRARLAAKEDKAAEHEALVASLKSTVAVQEADREEFEAQLKREKAEEEKRLAALAAAVNDPVTIADFDEATTLAINESVEAKLALALETDPRAVEINRELNNVQTLFQSMEEVRRDTTYKCMQV